VPRPLELLNRYAPGGTVVSLPGSRTLHRHVVRDLDGLATLARTNRWRKLLIFCNRREDVEQCTRELSALWSPYPVFAHHASLSVAERREAEEGMRSWHTAICVATSTLEIGIDLGDVDAVALFEPPWTVSSLVQRLGRAGRRSGSIHAVAVSKSLEDDAVWHLLFDAVEAGAVENEPYEPDLSVVVQQTLSYVFGAQRAVSTEELMLLLSPLCSGDDLLRILDHLRATGWLELRHRGWYPAERLEEDALRGLIHSNIPDEPELTVVEAGSWSEIGRIVGVPDDPFVLSGRCWKILALDAQRVIVRRVQQGEDPPAFRRTRKRGRFARWLPPDLSFDRAEPS
jgi:ATP-dependent Lhr-like helicase